MANPEHLDILNQGVEIWNQWRTESPDIVPVLSGTTFREGSYEGINLSSAKLNYCNLIGVILDRANLSGAKLVRSNLSRSRLVQANLTKAKLQHSTLLTVDLSNATAEKADLNNANFRNSNLYKANLNGADLSWTNLQRVNLNYASFRKTKLNFTNFDGARCVGTDFSYSQMNRTIFSDNDLSSAKNLDSVQHQGPSTIGVNTLHQSSGMVSQVFLRGCGLGDWEIEAAKLHNPKLANEDITDLLYKIHSLRAHQALQIKPLFISYSHQDGHFVDEIEELLNAQGIRFWRDIHHATAGRLERQIDRAIRLNPTVLIVLSLNSVKSDWVQHEARIARQLELETGRDTLCPIALDDSWKTCGWPERLREQIMEYNILDFSKWQETDYLERMFARLIEGLDLFYK